ICLQNAERKMIEKLINILSKSSKGIKEWQNEWHTFFTDNKKKLTPYENLWAVFDIVVSSIGLVKKKTDNIIQKIKSVQNSIPNEKNHQLLKDKIQQMRANANRLSDEITNLKKQEVKLRDQIKQQRTGSWCNTLRKNIFQTHQNNINERLDDISRSIKDKNKSLKNEEQTFHRKAAEIIEQNTKAQIRVTQSMKQQFIDIIKPFDIFSNEFQKALANCNPEEDFNQWKQNILHKNAEQSFESSDKKEDHDEKPNRFLKSFQPRPTENESSDDETCLRQSPVKSRSTRNKHRHEKTNQHLKSFQYRSNEDESSDDETYLRQAPVKSRSTRNKNRHEKTNQHLKSFQYRSNENESSDDEISLHQAPVNSRSTRNENRHEKTNQHLKFLKFRSIENENSDK
ncbi:unnamed protein product, partial [Rotaria sp. Silwood2]